MVYYIYNRGSGKVDKYNNKIDLCKYLYEYLPTKPRVHNSIYDRCMKQLNANNWWRINVVDLKYLCKQYRSLGILICSTSELGNIQV